LIAEYSDTLLTMGIRATLNLIWAILTIIALWTIKKGNNWMRIRRKLLGLKNPTKKHLYLSPS
jgi:hypothetical protein